MKKPKREKPFVVRLTGTVGQRARQNIVTIGNSIAFRSSGRCGYAYDDYVHVACALASEAEDLLKRRKMTWDSGYDVVGLA